VKTEEESCVRRLREHVVLAAGRMPVDGEIPAKAASVPRRLAVDNLTEGGLLQATPLRARSAAIGNSATAGYTTILL
jgi:hypothetical protein